MLFIPAGVSHIVTSSVSSQVTEDGSREAFSSTLSIFLNFKGF